MNKTDIGLLITIVGLLVIGLGFVLGLTIWGSMAYLTHFTIVFILGVILALGGLIFMVVGSFMRKGDSIAEPEIVEVTNVPKDSETFNYISTLCPYCGSIKIKNALIEKADTSVERKSKGFRKKYLFDCNTYKSIWLAVEK